LRTNRQEIAAKPIPLFLSPHFNPLSLREMRMPFNSFLPDFWLAKSMHRLLSQVKIVSRQVRRRNNIASRNPDNDNHQPLPKNIGLEHHFQRICLSFSKGWPLREGLFC